MITLFPSVAIAAIWIVLLYAPIIFSSLAYTEILVGIPKNFLLIRKTFPYSVIDLLLIVGYTLFPWKTFWFNEFSFACLYYGSPVFVPFMMIFSFRFSMPRFLACHFFTEIMKNLIYIQLYDNIAVRI